MTLYLDDGDAKLYLGDVRRVLDDLPAATAQTCVTSPPYWGLRDYGHDEQIGLEASPDEYVATMVDVFRRVRRVLRADGTLWLNLGDSYAANGTMALGSSSKSTLTTGSRRGAWAPGAEPINVVDRNVPAGLKPKDLVGIPWRVAFALQTDGWYLRSAIVWHKPNPMPESVTDRPTSSYEHVFLLAPSATYYYDADAIREPSDHPHLAGKRQKVDYRPDDVLPKGGKQSDSVVVRTEHRNARNVWTIPTTPFPGAHFATFPPDLARRCILAGTAEGDTVLDPFAGSGTTLHTARTLGRRSIGIELNEQYARIAADRLAQQTLLAGGAS